MPEPSFAERLLLGAAYHTWLGANNYSVKQRIAVRAMFEFTRRFGSSWMREIPNRPSPEPVRA